MTKTMRREQNRIRRRTVRACYTSAWLTLVLVVLIAIIAGLTLDARAQSSGVLYNEDGYDFNSGNIIFKQESPLPDFNTFTIEAEVYVDPTLDDNAKAGSVCGNLVAANLDKDAWLLDINNYGSVRFYHEKYGRYFFGVDNETGKSICTTVNMLGDNAYAANDGSPADVRTYMTDASGNPKFARISVIIDTATGYGHLYIDGDFVCSMTDATEFKDVTFTHSEVEPCIAIGGDFRVENEKKFNGKIRNIALYGDIRSEEEIYEYGNNGFTVDKYDPNLIFAYDLCYTDGTVLTDLSKSSIDAKAFVRTKDDPTSVTYVDPDTTPETSYYGAELPLGTPLLYLYVDKDNDGVAEYVGAFTQFNGRYQNSVATTYGAFQACGEQDDRYRCYLVLQADFTETTGHYVNMAYVNADIYIDLNGYSLTAKAGNSIFSAECKGAESKWKNPTVTFFNSKPQATGSADNGCIINDSAYPLIASIAYGAEYVKSYYTEETNRNNYQTYKYTFEGITFKFGDSYSATNPFVRYREASATSEDANSTIPAGMLLGVNITFNDCVFDMSATTAAANVLFDAQDDICVSAYGNSAADAKATETVTTVLNTVCNMTVNGGEIITGENLNTLTFAQKNAYTELSDVSTQYSDVRFGVGACGEYVKVTVPEGTSIPDGSLTAIPSTWTALSAEAGDTVGIYSEGDISEVSRAFTFANITWHADGVAPTEYVLRPSVQYEGKGDYVAANEYYSKNFAVFVTQMDKESGSDGDWKFLGGADYPFNGESADNTVEGLSHIYISRPETGITGYDMGYLNHAVAVMTKDCTVTIESSGTESKYSNFGQIRGRLTYDLGGHTLIWDSNTRLINAEAKIGNYYNGEEATYNTEDYLNDNQDYGLYHKTRFDMKNGRFVTGGSTLIVMSAYSTTGGDNEDLQYHNYTGTKLFELDFSNVTFAMTDEQSAIEAFLLYHYNSNLDNLINKRVDADITFTDCVFDITNAQNVKAKTLFNATDPTYNTGSAAVTDSSGNVTTAAVYNINTIANITVNGGEIIATGAEVTKFKIAECYNITDSDTPHKNRANNMQGASVTFGMGSSLKYPTVTFPAGSTHPYPVFQKDTGVYLGDLNVADTNSGGYIGSLHIYCVDESGAKRSCTNDDHDVEYTTPENLLTYSKNDALIDGSLVFHLKESVEENGDLAQGYGTYIPAYYHDLPDEYPLYVINQSKICVGVYSNWKYAANKVESFNNGTLILRRNFEIGAHADDNGAFSDTNGGDDGSSGYLAGVFTIDLNNKTFTMGGTAYFIDLTLGGTADNTCDKEVTVKNGSVVNNNNSSDDTKGRGPICVNYLSTYNSEYYTEGYTQYTFTFDNVDFSTTENAGATASPTFWLWENGYTTLEEDTAYADKAFLKVDATFNDCSITALGESAPAIPMRIPYAYGTDGSYAYDRTIFNVTVNGGSISTKSGIAFERNVDVNTTEGHVSRTDNIFFFDKGSGGKYPTLAIPTELDPPMHIFLESTGQYRGELTEGLDRLPDENSKHVQLSYAGGTPSDGYTVYEMTAPEEITIKTATGTTVDGSTVASYGSADGYVPACIVGCASDYPYWVFDGCQLLLATNKYGEDGVYDTALAFAVGRLAKDDTHDRTVTVYLAADATVDGELRYTNLCYSHRAIALDLGGHTLTVDKTGNYQSLIFYEQKSTRDNRLVVIQNGDIILKNDAAVVIFDSFIKEDNGYLTDHTPLTPIVVLKDLNIISDSGHGETAIVARPHVATEETQPMINPELAVISCTVDTSANGNATVTLVDTADDYGRVNIYPTVDGGSLVANIDYGSFTIVDDVDKIIFTNAQSGAYTTLTLPSSSERPLDVYRTDCGNGIFVINSAGDDVTVYEMGHFQSLDLGIKTNLVFAQELLMMIYVPEDEEGNLTKFSVDGFEFRRSGFGGLNYRRIGGKKYYAVPVSLPAKEAARDIPVTATVGLDGAEFTISFTVSLTEYASSVLSVSTAPEKAAQKALVLDTLAYIKSAYAYFNCADKTEVAEEIDRVLTAGGYSDRALTKSEGTTVATGLTSHTLLLDSRPIIRLYVDKATYGDSIFKFKQGDKDIPYITHCDSEGKIDYIDIALLAYRIPSEITYEIITEDREAHTTATVSGSYHINSYYDSAIAQNNTALADIVTRFYLYCQSASAYACEASSQCNPLCG